jgi:hypothetical protein
MPLKRPCRRDRGTAQEGGLQTFANLVANRLARPFRSFAGAAVEPTSLAASGTPCPVFQGEMLPVIVEVSACLT